MIRDIKDIAKYIGLSLLSKGLSVSPLKLQKVMYYVQSWYMVFFGRENTLFKEAPEAWVNGPVYPAIYNEYRSKVPGMCDHLTLKHFDSSNPSDTLKELSIKLKFTNEEIKCVDSIVTLYGAKTQNQLILMTHSESPWVDARGSLLPFEYSNNVITHAAMFNYYNDRRQKRLNKQ